MTQSGRLGAVRIPLLTGSPSLAVHECDHGCPRPRFGFVLPGAEASVTPAKLPVFTGLEDGMPGITPDPGFAKNGWIYLNRSLPETFKDEKAGGKAGIIRTSRFTLRGDTGTTTAAK